MSTLNALYAAVTGMDAQQVRIQNISNNLSNINTSGFKSDHATFEDLMYEQVKTPGTGSSGGSISPVGIQMGNGTKVLSVYKDFKQGDFSQTNRELDIAVEGKGFLQVTLDNGETAYTRSGSLKVNQDGNIVDAHGYALEPSIAVPNNATSLTIAKDGTVTATVAGSSSPSELGKFTLANFTNPAGLKAIGENLYQETQGSGSPTSGNPGADGLGTMLQGFLENSNVNLAEELINMIVAQRSYEANSKVLSTANDMLRAANNVI